MKFTFCSDTLSTQFVAKTPKAVILPILDGNKLTKLGSKLDKHLSNFITTSLDHADFKAAEDKMISFTPDSKHGISRLFLFYVNAKAIKTTTDIENCAGGLFATVNTRFYTGAKVIFDLDLKGINEGDQAAHFAQGFSLKSYQFLKYHATPQAKNYAKPNPLKEVSILTSDPEAAKAKYKELTAIAEGAFLVRDLVSEPPNVLTPEAYMERCKELKKLGLTIKVLDEKKMKKLGMNALLGVAQGSANKPYTVIFEYEGNPKAKDKTPLCFVGKGVTFDTGGISLKPGPGMWDMKWDMGGSAIVVGIMKTLALRKAKVNVVGVVGLVENMPGHNAQRPGDIVTSMSGQTIEVLNTDAEGRLLLADLLTYTQQEYKPHTMLNFATLTGAIIIALGSEYAGLFSNDDGLAEQLTKAGLETNEKVWRLPLHPNYNKGMDSMVADMRNISSGRDAGSIRAAEFLQRFVGPSPTDKEKKTKWAHLDVAAMVWSETDLELSIKGGTGYGVRLLDQFVRANYEI